MNRLDFFGAAFDLVHSDKVKNPMATLRSRCKDNRIGGQYGVSANGHQWARRVIGVLEGRYDTFEKSLPKVEL